MIKHALKYTPIAFLFIITTLFAILTVKGVAGNPAMTEIKNNLDQMTKPFELSPERGRYVLLYSIAKRHSFALDQQLADVAYPDVGYIAGRFYVFFDPGISLLALPLFLIGWHFQLAQVSAYFTTSLFAVGTVLLLYKIATIVFRLPTWAALAATFTFAFGSTALSYQGTLYQHHATIFLVLVAFYSVYKARKAATGAWWWMSLCWLSVGLSLAVDYPNIALMVPILCYALPVMFTIRQRLKKTYALQINFGMVLAAVWFAIIVAGIGYYNIRQFGDWKKTSAGLIGYLELKKNNILPTDVNNKQITILQQQKNPVKFFSDQNVPNGLYELLIAPDKGLFIFSPIFLLSILGLYERIRKQQIEDAVFVAIIILNLFVYASFGDPWGGWAYGPRYLIPAMSLLSIYVGVWLTGARTALRKSLFTILFSYSCLVAFLGAVTTNAIPPKSEAIALHTEYGIARAFVVLEQGKSSNFLYNSYFSHYMTLPQYLLFLVGLSMMVTFGVLFLLPDGKVAGLSLQAKRQRKQSQNALAENTINPVVAKRGRV